MTKLEYISFLLFVQAVGKFEGVTNDQRLESILEVVEKVLAEAQNQKGEGRKN